VGLSEVATVDGLRANSAVEGTLGGRVTTSGPAKDVAIVTEHGVLLLETEKASLSTDLVVDDRFEHVTGVGSVRGTSRVHNLAHDQDIVSATDGIGADKDRVEDAIRVFALSLAGRRTIERPLGEVLGVHAGHRLLEDLGLGAHLVEDSALLGLTLIAIIPDVLNLLGEGVDTHNGEATLMMKKNKRKHV
jgi:hypothetical protein